ncbi:glucuronate isomerase [Roseimaritima sediminicola]|uniref:glucuronate isomerase n=1 Tax=Roseimaritima sediminicola TaxID=2662066 RepID=UPI00192A497B|nr:glucuronate isomerase [Roseimaritima sediminicola]
MSDQLRQTIYQALADIRLIDPHTHINPHAPASDTLADVLGYHYYTELAHSAGMPRDLIEQPGLGPREKVQRLVGGLEPLENTVQYSWLIDICRRFFGFDGGRLDGDNWEAVYDAAEQQMQVAQWPDMVLERSNVEAVFLTNDFDDALSGFDTRKYIPCLRTDDLVFHLAKPEVRERLQASSGVEVRDLGSLRAALEQRFDHFVRHGARACAISLPPGFAPGPVADGRAATALEAVLRDGVAAQDAHRDALARRVFWTLAELCDHHGLPFDLMIGVNRGVYPEGVYQGQDLYDSRVSLIQYKHLFNAFPDVKFPISVLASVTNQELVSYAWIFPNVITNGHWWYSNTPSFIERDAAARLEAVPQTKQIGYYSDAYKLEFVAPKFDMYRRILAKVLCESFVIDRGWSEEQAIELGHRVLRGNVETIFPDRTPEPSGDPSSVAPPAVESAGGAPEGPALAAGSSAVAGEEVAGVLWQQAPETQAPETQAPETPAAETDAAETEPAETEPAETQAAETEPAEFDWQDQAVSEQPVVGPVTGSDAPSAERADTASDDPLAAPSLDQLAADDSAPDPLAPPQPETPQLETPQLETPELETPELETPELETPAGITFDAEQELLDEQDDAQLWNAADDQDDLPDYQTTDMDDLPTVVEDAAPPAKRTPEQDREQTPAPENSSLAFDQQQEDADAQDDFQLWADDEEELLLEPLDPTPPETSLPHLEEYEPLNDSGTSLFDEDSGEGDDGEGSDQPSTDQPEKP